MYKTYIKGCLDFILALLGLILLSPIIILVTIFLFFANQGKPFFIQPRPGKDGKIFNIIKFKTMNDRKDKEGNLLSDTHRITPVGSFVRKVSLDELPQLINVLKSEMSLIGPRPLLIKYLPFYTEKESLRHSVRPGITGWAQINGRNTLNWDSRLAHDVYYIENISLKLDIQILIKTIKKVFKSEDIFVDTTSQSFKDLNEERKINFRLLEKPDQLETLLELHHSILKGKALENKNIYYDSNFGKFLAKLIELPYNYFFIIEKGSLIKGFAHFIFIDEENIFLNNFAISEDLNYQGLGKKLFFYSVNELMLLHKKAENLRLDVFLSNKFAFNWYTKIGFAEEKTVDWFQLYSNLKTHESDSFKIIADSNGFLGLYDEEIKLGTIINMTIILHKSDYIYKINGSDFECIVTNDNSFIKNPLLNSDLISYDLIDSSMRMKISLKQLNENYFNGQKN